LVIEARGISKRFFLSHNPELKVRVLGLFGGLPRQRVEEFWALKSVSLSIAEGDSVGLIGRNGSGKSTLLKVIAGIHRPSAGQLLVARGARISSMIELGTGFHPELTGEENVMMNTSIHGLSRAEALAVYDDIVAYSGLRHFMDVPIKNYSSGMHMRLGSDAGQDAGVRLALLGGGARDVQARLPARSRPAAVRRPGGRRACRVPQGRPARAA
jgi:ABC-2 type transport system ATP-binding protein/lipopolysaccharide transport system ATP-binding protein